MKTSRQWRESEPERYQCLSASAVKVVHAQTAIAVGRCLRPPDLEWCAHKLQDTQTTRQQTHAHSPSHDVFDRREYEERLVDSTPGRAEIKSTLEDVEVKKLAHPSLLEVRLIDHALGPVREVGQATCFMSVLHTARIQIMLAYAVGCKRTLFLVDTNRCG